MTVNNAPQALAGSGNLPGVLPPDSSSEGKSSKKALLNLFAHVITYSLVAIWKMGTSAANNITAGTDAMNSELGLDEAGQKIMTQYGTLFAAIGANDVACTTWDEGHGGDNAGTEVSADATTYGFHSSEGSAISQTGSGIHSMITTGTGSQTGGLQTDQNNAMSAKSIFDTLGQIMNPA